MGYSHETVVKNFAARKLNRKGDCDWIGGNVYSEGDTLYSYGRHFRLAYYLGERDGAHLFLKNGDRRSTSTSQHQAIVQRACAGPTVSFSALYSAGIRVSWLTLDNIADFTADQTTSLYRAEDGALYHDTWDEELVNQRFDRPGQGMFIKTGEKTVLDSDGKSQCVTTGYWHILGGCLLTYHKSAIPGVREEGEGFYLCSLDENSYFVSELSGTPAT